MWTLSWWLLFLFSDLCLLLFWWAAFLILLNACRLITTHLPTCCRVIDPVPALRALPFCKGKEVQKWGCAAPFCSWEVTAQKGGGAYSGSQNKTLVSPVKCPYFGPGDPISSTVPPAFEQLPDSTLFSVKPSGSWSGSENCFVVRTIL